MAIFGEILFLFLVGRFSVSIILSAIFYVVSRVACSVKFIFNVRKIYIRDDSMKNKKIYDVATFLQEVSARIRQYDDQKWIFLYRGESKEYEKPCIPNIFRAKLMVNNQFFEKNLFDTMRQHKLSGEKNYLENAIDAQHGEFPSRLLDVTYNCLVALYFAVTPYYHNEESKYDNENGKVYIFIIDEIYSPSSKI